MTAAAEVVRLLDLAADYTDPNPGRDHIDGQLHALRCGALMGRTSPEWAFVGLVHDLAPHARRVPSRTQPRPRLPEPTRRLVTDRPHLRCRRSAQLPRRVRGAGVRRLRAAGRDVAGLTHSER